jgi:hypothetical protein
MITGPFCTTTHKSGHLTYNFFNCININYKFNTKKKKKITNSKHKKHKFSLNVTYIQYRHQNNDVLVNLYIYQDMYMRLSILGTNLIIPTTFITC